MTITRVGTNAKYATGWDAIFAKGRASAAAKKTSAKKAPAKKSAKRGKK